MRWVEIEAGRKGEREERGEGEEEQLVSAV